MKISILIPTHNRPSLFEMCFKSALSQNYYDLEIIVSDDSEGKGYAQEIVDKYKDSRVKYFKKASTGPTDNYINLIQKATGDYSIFLEDDDFFTTKNSISNYADFFYPQVTGIIFQSMKSDEIKKFFAEKKHRVFTNEEFFTNFPDRKDPCGFQLGQLMFKTDIVKKLNYSEFTECPFLDEVTLFFLSFHSGLIVESSGVSFFLGRHGDNMTWGNNEIMLKSGFKHIEEVSIFAKKFFEEEKVSIWKEKMIRNYSDFFKGLV